MRTYKTPNVYVEEVPTLPPSVVPVATAVPAFIGCTEKAGNNNEYRHQPIRISSLLDYTSYFGGAYATSFKVDVAEDAQTKTTSITDISFADGATATPKYLMYYALRMFFDNGGGPCYIVSIGDYSAKPDKKAFEDGLAAIRKEDEPTLLLLADGVNILSTDYYSLCQGVLKQCTELQDRFAIFDVLASDKTTNGIGAEFRQGIGTSDLKYGAAYYPYLQTALSTYYTDDSVVIEGLTAADTQAPSTGSYNTGADGLLVTYSGPQSENPRIRIALTDRQSIAVEVVSGVLVIRLPEAGATVSEILAVSISNNSSEKYSLAGSGDDSTTIDTPLNETSLEYVSSAGTTLGDTSVKTDRTELYNQIKTALNAIRVVLPPSGAVAGVYAKVDRERGVWKAPANVSLASVIGPTVKITNEEQDNLNVDATAGKSINAIRSFTGKGTLIWGARTLAGNDNEWRYISVRRLFNLIEESTQKATNFVVFESNTAITWLKVKTIIETYLEGLWRQGALAGDAPENAYFVNVGLGRTMTEQDILEGRMIVEIGIAAVRPAEFIVLRFSHKLQQA